MYQKACVAAAAIAAISIPALGLGGEPFLPGRYDPIYGDGNLSGSAGFKQYATSVYDATYGDGNLGGPGSGGLKLYATRVYDPTYGDGNLPSPVRIVELRVTENGFEPTELVLEKGETVELLVTRMTDKTCARRLVVESQGIDSALPLGQAVLLTLSPTRRGSIRYACATGMIRGALIVR